MEEQFIFGRLKMHGMKKNTVWILSFLFLTGCFMPAKFMYNYKLTESNTDKLEINADGGSWHNNLYFYIDIHAPGKTIDISKENVTAYRYSSGFIHKSWLVQFGKEDSCSYRIGYVFMYNDFFHNPRLNQEHTIEIQIDSLSLNDSLMQSLKLRFKPDLTQKQLKELKVRPWIDTVPVSEDVRLNAIMDSCIKCNEPTQITYEFINNSGGDIIIFPCKFSRYDQPISDSKGFANYEYRFIDWNPDSSDSLCRHVLIPDAKKGYITRRLEFCNINNDVPDSLFIDSVYYFNPVYLNHIKPVFRFRKKKKILTGKLEGEKVEFRMCE
jgi:hypothetical protein